MLAQPRVIWMPGGLRMEIHLTGEETRGAHCLTVDEPPPRWSLPEHRHSREAETIHVLAGEFEVTLESSVMSVGCGETVHVPAGVAHSTRNLGARGARRLVIYSPAGIEQFFLEAGAVTADADVNLAALLQAATRYGWEFLAAPGR